ncbi:MAG: coenzyme F420-0:L-glutamate ligase [Cenarchaeum sp. SB0665_bin_23]|nr:coenzyme F420-0:L-glutamate ligase [Cenarchaeum sp. SB0667_bin_13]MXY61443.1 coenzyme F420-0:L-glutamate ligase [Cenarchaeum sp. SB0665_bin_23]MXZ94146.1 coenzyme F420-0:L-glutamate ligase [Cenarchaeum sp. SB0666_bin_15]MYB46198.1 coenzyme F420-0:L-glutamate ligase [Cenarchaeum sp. SB0662_bin_33]MYC79273.1 coenzyme F420-0:L-glutamate ligase [Cenarchaeum sp. SB0661_bin_35]MYD59284.1 coenzyme F420-0:L-glutamate ligase [Cenarchaeum sp. SB0678_bin_8]MYG33000.1 coenzyme F420-0:L-glutamate ligas
MIQAIPVHMDGDITCTDDVCCMIIESADDIREGDVIVVAQKIVSKSEGRLVRLSDVRPSSLAVGIAGEYDKDARVVELVLREARRIVRMKNGIIITQRHDGHISANSGVDVSNVPPDCALLLPENSDESAHRIRYTIRDRLQINVGVIISDTLGRPFRVGQTDMCIGCSGVAPLLDYTGKTDVYDRVLRVSVTAMADQLAGAAELVMGKTRRTPVAILRGTHDYYNMMGEGTARDLIRHTNDLFGQV